MPDELLKRINLVFLLYEENVILRQDLYRIFKTQIKKKVNHKWKMLPDEFDKEKIRDYIDLMNHRATYFLEELNDFNSNMIKGLEVFRYEPPHN